MSDHEESRAAFEAAHSEIGNARRRYAPGKYLDREIQQEWEAWCRALDYAASRECVWEPSSRWAYIHHTSCGTSFTYDDKIKYCPGCGGRVKIQETQTTTEQ